MKATQHTRTRSPLTRRVPIFKSLPTPQIPPEAGYLETDDLRALLRLAQAFLASSDPVSKRLTTAGEKLAAMVDASAWLIVVHPAVAVPPIVLSGGRDNQLAVRTAETYGRALTHLNAVGSRLLGRARTRRSRVIALIDRQRNAVLSLRCEDGSDFATWVSVHRDPAGRKPFAERERRIVELFNSQAAWMLLPAEK